MKIFKDKLLIQIYNGKYNRTFKKNGYLSSISTY